MASFTPDGSGYVRQSVTVFSGLGAWFNGQPLIDNTAGLAYNNIGRNAQSIYCLYSIVGSASVTDIRIVFLSFDVSSITSAPTSAELKILGSYPRAVL